MTEQSQQPDDLTEVIAFIDSSERLNFAAWEIYKMVLVPLLGAVKAAPNRYQDGYTALSRLNRRIYNEDWPGKDRFGEPSKNKLTHAQIRDFLFAQKADLAANLPA